MARCCDLALGCLHGQKRLNFWAPHVFGVAKTAVADKPANSVDIGLLGAQGVVHVPQPLTHLVKQAGNALVETYSTAKPIAH
jgi:hypothetical protein